MLEADGRAPLHINPEIDTIFLALEEPANLETFSQILAALSAFDAAGGGVRRIAIYPDTFERVFNFSSHALRRQQEGIEDDSDMELRQNLENILGLDAITIVISKTGNNANSTRYVFGPPLDDDEEELFNNLVGSLQPAPNAFSDLPVTVSLPKFYLSYARQG